MTVLLASSPPETFSSSRINGSTTRQQRPFVHTRTNSSFIQFLTGTTIGSLLAESSPRPAAAIVDVSERATLADALRVMDSSNVLSLPVRSIGSGRHIALLTARDALSLMLFGGNAPPSGSDSPALLTIEEAAFSAIDPSALQMTVAAAIARLGDSSSIQLHSIASSATLSDLLSFFAGHPDARRILIINNDGDGDNNNVTESAILSQTDMLRLLYRRNQHLPKSVLDAPVTSVIPAPTSPDRAHHELAERLTVNVHATAADAFRRVLENSYPVALPIVDDDGALVADLSAKHVVHAVLRRLSQHLSSSTYSTSASASATDTDVENDGGLAEWTQRRRMSFEQKRVLAFLYETYGGNVPQPLTNRPTFTVSQTIAGLLRMRARRVWIVNADKRPSTYVSVYDIIAALHEAATN
ncbi:hypothetical protein GQ42DRAFT_164179 [Ramicandelaber brevisporus]|nr:hypothetical protein GQ42DRAFT_164179 [Ramicandelaber brevisporus]